MHWLLAFLVFLSLVGYLLVFGPIAPWIAYDKTVHPTGIGHTIFELWCAEGEAVVIYLVPIEEWERAECPLGG